MPEDYRVRIAKAEHVFSAAHFITFGGECERLHGHNYRVSAEVAAPLDEDSLVVDFLLVRKKLCELLQALDHYMLLPTKHPELKVDDDGRQVSVAFGPRHWSFPSGDCRLLPVSNTTAEMLARHIGSQLQAALQAAGYAVASIQLEVDECDGQAGVWRWTP